MVREVKKKTLTGSGFAAPSKEATRMAMATYRVDPLDKMIRDIGKASERLSGQESTGKVKETGRGMGDTFNPFKDRVDASDQIKKTNFFSPDRGSEVRSDVNTSVFAGAESGTNFAVANDANKAVGITNQATTNLADASYDTSYKQETSPGYEDSYKQIKQIFDKPEKDDFKTKLEKRFSKSMYGGEGISEEQAIDTFRRKNLDYESGTDFFGRKVDYSTETIKRYMATDAKEKYEKDQAFKRTQQLNEARKIAAQERKKIDDKAYFRAMQKFDEPSITQKVSNFVFGTDLKGKEDPRNINLLTKDERLSTLRGVERSYGVPGISVDPYGNPTIPYDKINPDTKFKTRTTDSQLSVEDFKAKENIERRKIFREEAGLSPNPNLMERTTKFLGDVLGGVSRIFTPAAQAGGMPSRGSLANTFTSGQSLGVSDASSFGGLSGLPGSMGDNISAGISGMRGNIGAAVEAGGMGGLNRGGSGDPRSSGRTVNIGGRTFRQSRFGRPQSPVKSPMAAGMGFGAEKARAIAKDNIARGGVSRGRAAARSRAQSAAKARKAAGQTVSSVNARNRARMRARAKRRSKGGRGRSKCDLRFKFNIMPLTNMHLLRDDLAEVAYFVKELQA